MWKTLADLLKFELGPEKDWQTFLRKVLSTILLAGCLSFGINEWQSFNDTEGWSDRPLHTRIERPGVKDSVIKYLNIVYEQHSNHLQSIWVYSWPDARTLLPVAHVGNPTDPIPVGYFTVKDAGAVGAMVFEQCATLERYNNHLIVCPIFAENDAWGVVVFVCDSPEQAPHDWRNMFRSLAHKLSHIIYQTHD